MEKPKIAMDKNGNMSMKLQLKLIALEGEKALAIIDELNKVGGSLDEFGYNDREYIKYTFGEIKEIVQDLDKLRTSALKYLRRS